MFFGQIGSQKLKFSKLTEIWYRQTFLYPFFDFTVYLLKNFCYSYFFGQIWSQNLKFSKLIWIWYRDILLYACYDFNGYFFKIFVIYIFWKNWSQNLTFSKLTEVWDKCTFLYHINPNLRDLFRGFVWGGGRGVG